LVPIIIDFIMKALLISVLLFFAFELHSQIVINSDGLTPDSSALLDLESKNRGFLPPRMTKAELVAILNPGNGLIVYCTDCSEKGTGSLALFQAGQWRLLSTQCMAYPPTEAVHMQKQDQITWKWHPSVNVSGYKWNTVNDYATAEDMGMDTAKTEDGLICNTPFTRYVWAYNSCGESYCLPMTLSTSGCYYSPCGKPMTVNHIAGEVAPVSKTVVYNTVNDIPGEPQLCWITQNLGSDRQALTVNDTSEESAGWYWQFNRKQGYKHDGITRTPNTPWITVIDDISDWEQVNDPCNHELGSEWRIPTYSEWINVDNQSEWNNFNDTWNSSLKIHWAGNLGADGDRYPPGEYFGCYWSSNENSPTTGWMLIIGSSVNISSSGKKYASTLRCVKDTCGLLSPGAGVHNASENQVVWSWQSVNGATSYKWNTSKDISSATDLGTDTIKTETGLTCNTPVTRFVWACDDCGCSNPGQLYDTTLICSFICGTSTITVEHIAGDVAPVNKTVTYGTVTNIPGEESKCWITQNLGSDRQALSVDDSSEPSAGWYWQFNRKQGFKNDGINLTPAGAWYTGNGNLTGWEAVNDPCSLELGTGWRIPTQTEWINVDVSGNWTDRTGPWNSALKLHSAGKLQSYDGELLDIGDVGAYWSSEYYDLYNSWGLDLSPVISNVEQFGRNDGLNLRCIKDCDPPAAPNQRTHNATPSQIIWKWYPVPGVSGYKISSVPIYNSAIDVGNNTLYTESGLPCNCSFTRYCWAYNACGASPSPVVFTMSTSPDPPPKPVALPAVPSITEIIWRWEPVPGAAGYLWRAGGSTTAIDVGNSVSYTQTGLTCQTMGYSGVCAYSDGCGYSSYTSLPHTWTLSDPPPAPAEGTHYVNGDTIIWNWDTVPGAQYYLLAKNNDYNDPIGYAMQGQPSFIETDVCCYWDYTRYLWAVGPCGYSIPVVLTQTPSPYPVTPAAEEPITTSTSITWRWHTVPGAATYRWNTTNDISTSIQTSAHQNWYTETGLQCEQTYTRWAWSLNWCESSLQPLIMIASTNPCFNCGTDTLIVNHNINGGVAPFNTTVVYSTTGGLPGETEKCWVAQNLGAERQALSKDDDTFASAGWYWQFNRMRGHVDAYWYWYSTISENSDWLMSNDPCRIELGFPWRLPTGTEWSNLDNAGNWYNWNHPWNSNLKLHAAGSMDWGPWGQNIFGMGEHGSYWSSSQIGETHAETLYFEYYECSMYPCCDGFATWKNVGHTVRCVRE
jgi:hypothetical protein